MGKIFVSEGCNNIMDGDGHADIGRRETEKKKDICEFLLTSGWTFMHFQALERISISRSLSTVFAESVLGEAMMVLLWLTRDWIDSGRG